MGDGERHREVGHGQACLGGEGDELFDDVEAAFVGEVVNQAGPAQVVVLFESQQESLAAAAAALVMQTLGTAYLQITKQWGDVIQVVIDVAPRDDESRAVLATAQRRHNRNLTAICRHLEDTGALRDDVDARLASRIITYYYGIDGLLRTREVFSWSLERSNEWLLARASAAVLGTPAEPVSPN